MQSESHSLEIAELMHRVKNNFQLVLSLINLQGDFTEDLDKEDQNSRLMTRVHAIALIQELLYQYQRQSLAGGENPRGKFLRLNELLSQLADYSCGVYMNRGKIEQFLVNVRPYLIDDHDGVAVALIFNEIFLNAVLFNSDVPGFSLEISDELNDRDYRIHCLHRSVSCELEGSMPAGGNLGVLLQENYCAQLGGTIGYKNTDNGLNIEMIFPLKLLHGED